MLACKPTWVEPPKTVIEQISDLFKKLVSVGKNPNTYHDLAWLRKNQNKPKIFFHSVSFLSKAAAARGVHNGFKVTHPCFRMEKLFFFPNYSTSSLFQSLPCDSPPISPVASVGFYQNLSSYSELFNLVPKPYKYFTLNWQSLIFTSVVEPHCFLLPESPQSPLFLSIAVGIFTAPQFKGEGALEF